MQSGAFWLSIFHYLIIFGSVKGAWQSGVLNLYVTVMIQSLRNFNFNFEGTRVFNVHNCFEMSAGLKRRRSLYRLV